MKSSIIQDESILQLNNEELKIKKKRRASNYFIFQNKLKESLISKKPVQLSRSISKNVRDKAKRKDEKNNNIIIKEYLHSHKFNLQRKRTKKKNCKTFNNQY